MASNVCQLTAAGIAQAIAGEDKDFTFVVSGVEYPCTRFQACFFSRRVAHLVASDRALDRLFLQTTDDSRHFLDVMRLMNGESIEITASNCEFLEKCARELENTELLSALLLKLRTNKLTLSNVVEKIHLKKAFQQDYSTEIEFAASQFFEFDLSFVASLTIDELDEILRSDKLKLESEDQLFDLIFGLVNEKDKGYAHLFRHVQFEYLTTENLDTFLEHVFPDFIDLSMWTSIRQNVRMARTFKDKEALTGSRYRTAAEIRAQAKDSIVECTCPSAFAGIISYLGDKCHGNVHNEGLVEITASSTDYNQCHRLVDYGWMNSWRSKDEPNSFVQFDFKSYQVALSGYSIKSDGSGWRHLCCWVIEVSDDGVTWEIVDNRCTKELCGKYVVKTYQCNHPRDEFCRFVRLRQTGSNSSGNDYLYFSEIEFFGILKQN